MAAEKNEFWIDDGDLEDMAQGLMTDHHPDALDARICYMWRTRAGKSGGKLQLAYCQKQSDQQKKLHGHDFVIVVAADTWHDLTPKQQEAVMLHELLHVGVEFDEGGDGDGRKFFIREHDCEEFSSVIRQYGLWRDELKEMSSALKDADSNG